MTKPSPPSPAPHSPADLAALRPRILHRDGMVLVIDKPAGLPVHAGPNARGRHIPVLTDYLDEWRFGLPRRPEAAHRLDKDTSGCLVLGRHPRATAQLNTLFREGRIAKTYWAVVEGKPQDDAGVIDLPLGKRDGTRGWWMETRADGLPSRTHWRVMGRGSMAGQELAWLELAPETGRTHQLRVHCAALGWPIRGDAIYGSGDRFAPPGLCLHARALSIPLFANKSPLVVTAPAPRPMQEALAACGCQPEPDHAETSQATTGAA